MPIGVSIHKGSTMCLAKSCRNAHANILWVRSSNVSIQVLPQVHIQVLQDHVETTFIPQNIQQSAVHHQVRFTGP